ncbi:hypothetical protein T02_14703 [Trichinella nativa]|uniref:Uncharacterized protein n=1 Tax=Trichinella nativa TaxID=6335 RepID=A0A0V1LGB4_9BILA|nr:hypothetical protein T02_14703 [Trichinella nativa]
MHCLTYGRKFIFGNVYKSSTLKILENVQLNIRYSVQVKKVQRKKREVLCDVARKVTFPSGILGVPKRQHDVENFQFQKEQTTDHDC